MLLVRYVLLILVPDCRCVLCRIRADYLAAEKDKMDAAGVALVLIGPGSVDQLSLSAIFQKVTSDRDPLLFQRFMLIQDIGLMRL
ncbi:hypothetical protein RDI58_021833 [Solanum bulbocastanum]|uniref:Uncharacterized protein n=1 Tax=Solanum bulbocastanum TaxID=147425 RepID=A0AAN8Y541_SOLBU